MYYILDFAEIEKNITIVKVTNPPKENDQKKERKEKLLNQKF